MLVIFNNDGIGTAIPGPLVELVLGMGMGSERLFSRSLAMGMGRTHHLEGVGEGKVMVLGVGWMLSLFVVDRLALEHQVWCGFFRSWHSGPKRALTLAALGKRYVRFEVT